MQEKNSAEHQAIVDAIDDQLRDAPGGGWRTAHAVPLPPVMQPVAGADSADLRWVWWCGGVSVWGGGGGLGGVFSPFPPLASLTWFGFRFSW